MKGITKNVDLPFYRFRISFNYPLVISEKTSSVLVKLMRISTRIFYGTTWPGIQYYNSLY